LFRVGRRHPVDTLVPTLIRLDRHFRFKRWRMAQVLFGRYTIIVVRTSKNNNKTVTED
jgi:hypothetical protein